MLAGRGIAADVAVFDVTDRGAIDDGVAAAARRTGRSTSSSTTPASSAARRSSTSPQQDWDAIIATNLTAPFLVSQAVLPGMIAAKRGKIIHIASLMSELARPDASCRTRRPRAACGS